MAKSKLQEEVIREKAMQLREGLDKMIAQQEISGVWKKPENASLHWDDPYVQTTTVTKGMISGFVQDSQASRMAREEAERLKWLDDTQNMRVVALNEACSMFKAYMENNENVGVDYKAITIMAKNFADFLVEGKS